LRYKCWLLAEDFNNSFLQKKCEASSSRLS
jgi:hypothetical protein